MRADLVELLQVIVRALVDTPDEIKIDKIEEEDKIVLELRVAPSDMGRVIGKQGRIAKAIRTIVKSSTGDSDKKVFVEILD